VCLDSGGERKASAMSALPLCTLPVFVGPSSLPPFDCGLFPLARRLSAPLTPLFATLANTVQATENTATLSPFPATLTSHVKHKSFVCHSYRKHGGWGAPCIDPPTSFPCLPEESASISFHCTYAPFVFIFLRTLLHRSKSYLSWFQALPHSLNKTPRGGVPLLATRQFLP
jgi:hypothetical protein